MEQSKPIYNINNKRLKSNDLNQTYFWHCRLGHANEKRISQLHRDGLLDSFDFESFDTCESCLLGKMTKSPFTHKSERAKELLGLIHTDVWGPFSTSARGGYLYFITFTDDFNRYEFVYLMRHNPNPLKSSRNSKTKYKINLARILRYFDPIMVENI